MVKPYVQFATLFFQVVKSVEEAVLHFKNHRHDSRWAKRLSGDQLVVKLGVVLKGHVFLYLCSVRDLRLETRNLRLLVFGTLGGLLVFFFRTSAKGNLIVEGGG